MTEVITSGRCGGHSTFTWSSVSKLPHLINSLILRMPGMSPFAEKQWNFLHRNNYPLIFQTRSFNVSYLCKERNLASEKRSFEWVGRETGAKNWAKTDTLRETVRLGEGKSYTIPVSSNQHILKGQPADCMNQVTVKDSKMPKNLIMTPSTKISFLSHNAVPIFKKQAIFLLFWLYCFPRYRLSMLNGNKTSPRPWATPSMPPLLLVGWWEKKLSKYVCRT